MLRVPYRHIALVLSCLVAGPAAASPQQGFGPLFDSPTSLEIAQVRADWSTRSSDVNDWRLETTSTDPITGYQFEIVSHVVDGQRHYGAIRLPNNYTAGAKYGVAVVCHGGLVGVTVEEVVNFLVHMPGLCVDDDFFLIVPSFRGEALNSTFGGPWHSGGSPSYADRDVDDTRSLLTGALDNYPDMDRVRVSAWGISRGGAVALLLGARDDRIRRVVDMFGFTDLALPTVEARVNAILNQGAPSTGLGQLVIDSVVQPYLMGVYTLAEARLAWIRRSPCYFANTMPPVQAHHGMQDIQVDSSHTVVLLDALIAAGAPIWAADGYFYPTGEHGLNSLSGHGMRVEQFLCDLQNGPRGFCGPMSPHAGGRYASIDYGGSNFVTDGELRLRVHHCPPSGFGLFFISPSTNYIPSGAGYLCLGVGTTRLGIAPIDANGFVDFPIDLSSPPLQAGSLLQVGASPKFQFVFRDQANPNGMWNFSNGLDMTIEP